MKKFITFTLVIAFALFSIRAVEQQNLMLMNKGDYSLTCSDTIPPRDSIMLDTVEIKPDYKHIKAVEEQTKLGHNIRGRLNDFMKKLAWRESRGDWTAVNRFGYAGKYQMGGAALSELNYSLDVDSFRLNPNIFPETVQDSLAIELVKLNRKRQKHYIKSYSGKIVNGIKVTESGILGAAHLVGGGNVRSWLKSNGQCCPEDGNGVSIEEYMVLFANYQITI